LIKKKQKYPFFATPIPSIFYSFAKSKTTHFVALSGMFNMAGQGVIQVSISLVTLKPMPYLLVHCEEKKLKPSFLHFHKFNIEGERFSFSSSSKLVPSVLEPLIYQA